MQSMDVSAVKLFVTNRNGVEPVNVILKDLTIRADRINGLGTIVRTVFDRVVYADPTSIEKDILIVGGQPKTPPGQAERPAGRPAPGARRGTPAPGPLPAAAAPVAAPAAMVAAPAGGGRGGHGGRAGGRPLRRAAGAVRVAAGNVSRPPGGPAPNAPPAPPKEPQKIPLDEVDSIHFERSPGMTARFIGQPNLDYTMPGRSYKPESEEGRPPR